MTFRLAITAAVTLSLSGCITANMWDKIPRIPAKPSIIQLPQIKFTPSASSIETIASSTEAASS